MPKLPDPYSTESGAPRPSTAIVPYRVPESRLGSLVADIGSAVTGTARQGEGAARAVAEGASGIERAGGGYRRAAAGYGEASRGYSRAASANEDIARERGATAATYHAGAAKFGETGDRIVAEQERMDKLREAEQERMDKLRAEDAFNRLRGTQLDLTAGQENGYQNVKGKDAVSQPILQDWTKKFATAQEGIESGLANDRQRDEFRRRAQIAQLQFTEGILHHLRGQGDEYAKEVYQGTLASEVASATANWSDPSAVGLSLARVDNAINSQAERLGWPQQYVDGLRAQDRGKIHAAVIGQAIGANDWVYAQKWAQANAGDLDPATAKAVEHAVADGTQKQLFNGYQTQFLAARDNAPALELLAKTVTGDPSLDEDRKNLLIGRIESRGEVLASKAARAQAQWEASVNRQITAVNSLTLAGYEPSAAQMAPLLAATKGTSFEPQVRQMIATANLTSRFRVATPVQQEATISQLEAEARKDPTKFDVTVIGKLKQIYGNQQSAIREDPTTFAVRQGLVDIKSPAAQPIDFSKPDQIGQSLAARFSLARSMVDRYQAPMKPLTKEEADMLSGVIKNVPTGQKGNFFGALARASGGDYDGYKALMGQIAPDDPVTAIAGLYAGRGNMITEMGFQPAAGQSKLVSDLILAGQAVLRPDRKTDGTPSKGAVWPMPKDTDLDKVFQSVERDAFSGFPTARRDMYEASRSIYAKLSVDAGDATGVLDTSRWKESIKLATGGIERYNGRSLVMPWGYDLGKFKDGLSTRIQALQLSGNLGDGMTPAKLRGLPVEPAGDGRYVFRAGDGIVAGKNGLPLLVDFNQPIYIPSGSFNTTSAAETEEAGTAGRMPLRSH